MKTLRDAKVGDTVKVVKLHGEGRHKAPHYGHGHYQGRGNPRAQGGPPGGPHGAFCAGGYELSVRKADAEMIEIA